MKVLFCVGLLCFFSSFVQASDTILVQKDGRLDVLVAKQAAINTRSRDEAFKVKAELMQKFPNQKVIALFQSPYFKIRLGNFADKEEAEKYKIEVSRIYPQGVYVIQDAVDIAPAASDQLSEP